jgi:predicted transcriptional regulator
MDFSAQQLVAILLFTTFHLLVRSTMGVQALKPTTIKLDTELRERLSRLSSVKDRSAHKLIIQAVTEFVEREEQRQAFLAEAVAAWEDYELTGIHLTAEEADDWLEQLEQGRDVEPPACHV